MKEAIGILIILFVTGCASTSQKTAHNPEGLRDDELVKTQIERIAKLERDMERRENELKFQHLKELQAMQAQTKSAAVVNTSCKFFCF
jgi:hypothetical protein